MISWRCDGDATKLSDVKALVRSIPDFPKPGVDFKDITLILKNNEAFQVVVKKLARRFKSKNIDIVASAEARGFILGSALAYALKAGFVPLRKPGKLPWQTVREEYDLEYDRDAFEMHVDGVKEGDNVLLVDDVLATGGTAQAAVKLVEKLGGRVVGVALLLELRKLKGRGKLNGYEVYSLMRL